MKALCATDLSAASEAAIENETCLRCLDRIGVDEMHLITVIPSNVHAGMPGLNFEERRKRALAAYERVVSEAGFAVETHVVRGTPHRRINGIAETIAADLIIIGSRGKSPLENRIIGSTARNLARTTVAPLLVNRVERGAEEPAVLREHLFRRMLYATDFSANAERAFETFRYLRHATQEATLVHINTPKDPEPDEQPPAARLESLAAQLQSWDVETSIDIREGDPTEEILTAETEHEPATILLGSRGQSRLRRLLLGSVSEDIVAKAQGNVLLVPAER